MASRRMKRETLARLIVVVLAAGFVLAAILARGMDRTIEVHAVMPEKGGWLPDSLEARAGEPLTLRLISDDVVHGFAIGQSDFEAVDLLPGRPVEVTLTFDRPGVYTYYCTRWCGPNHWRMRGTITVEGETASEEPPSAPPLYVTLDLDLDAPHDVPQVPSRRPSAVRGALLWVEHDLEARALPSPDRATSPYALWRDRRARPETSALRDDDLWDVVAYLWQGMTTPEALREGRELYARNCAACHGVGGAGDGVFGQASGEGDPESPGFGHESTSATDFTDPAHMLGASPALLQGKIVRGGMGTGMPSWGLILTEEESWAVSDYLWMFQFEYEAE